MGSQRVRHDWATHFGGRCCSLLIKLLLENTREVVFCISSVQSLSRVRLFATPWIAACQASLSISNYRRSLKLMFIELVMPSNHLILCLSPPPPALNLSQHQGQVSSNESVLRIRWPKYWSLSFSISPSNEYSGLISFRIDWLDFPVVQGTLNCLLQHHKQSDTTERL